MHSRTDAIIYDALHYFTDKSVWREFHTIYIKEAMNTLMIRPLWVEKASWYFYFIQGVMHRADIVNQNLPKSTCGCFLLIKVYLALLFYTFVFRLTHILQPCA